MKKSMGAKTLVFPSPVWCIGTYDKNGKPNVATVAWGGVCCSEPPCVAISLRKATYTYGNILEKKVFTVSVASDKYVKEADYFGIESGRNADKFKIAKLTPVKSDIVDAPYVSEFPMILECRLIHQYEIGLHTQFIGEILDVKIDDDKLTEDNKTDMEHIRPIVFSALVRKYHSVGKFIGKAFEIGKKI
jgi:flavin reductase (DIM6/NTAB) family NADH-FMN oxidoreductase RutF